MMYSAIINHINNHVSPSLEDIKLFNAALNQISVSKGQFLLKPGTHVKHEYFVVKGFGDNIDKVKVIFFEHHYDQMIIKNYKFSQINQYLRKLNFKKIIKLKMPFRKTFEYIYVNDDFK